MTIVQSLKVSDDLVKVSVNVSQVPWNHPASFIFISIAIDHGRLVKRMSHSPEHDAKYNFRNKSYWCKNQLS